MFWTSGEVDGEVLASHFCLIGVNDRLETLAWISTGYFLDYTTDGPVTGSRLELVHWSSDSKLCQRAASHVLSESAELSMSTVNLTLVGRQSLFRLIRGVFSVLIPCRM
jgi:hypothetical protein